MSIDYTLRLINTLNGDQVIKTAALTVMNPNKYGKKLAKINLPDGAQSMKVYNKIVQKNFEISNLFAPKSTQVTVVPVPPVPVIEKITEKVVVQEYLPIKQMDIMLSQENALNTVGNETDRVIYGQGRLVLPIDPVDNFIKFTAYQVNPVDSTNQKRIDLNNGSTFKLNFGQTSKFSFDSLTDPSLTSPSRGEIAFRIPKESALQILQMTKDNLFMITLISKTDGTETLFYTGTWVSSANYANLISAKVDAEIAVKNEKTIIGLKEQVTNLTKENAGLITKKIEELVGKENAQAQTPKTVNSTAAVEPPASQKILNSKTSST